MKKILLIDGNFFSSRAMFALQRSNPDITFSTPKEKEMLKRTLWITFNSLYKSFNNDNFSLIDNIIFVSDDYVSWRKLIQPHKPYYLTEDVPLKYKENRVEKKEESPIDWNSFYSVHEEFVADLSNYITVMKLDNMEGDDLLYLIAEKLNNLNVQPVIFCNDGDLKQILKFDNTILFRIINSKDSPEGEICISERLYNEHFDNSAMCLLKSKDLSLDKLFSVKIGTAGKTEVKREAGKSIVIGNPYQISLVKSICGDAKDNIFPIIRWKSSTGTKNFKVTEKILVKTLTALGKDFDKNTCIDIIQNKENVLGKLLVNLPVACKQQLSKEELNSVGKHCLHNMKLNILSRKYIPENLIESFDNSWKIIEEIVINISSPDLENIFGIINKNVNINNQKDSASDLISDSLPDDIMDSILNS